MWEVHHSRIEEWTHHGGRFHACLCDPPYLIGFMGKKWDKSRSPMETAEGWGRAILPLLIPGALVMMFGGTRAWHWLAVGMEQAGFEMWDTLMWVHGQGFPKSQDISKLIDKKNGNEREVIGAHDPRSDYDNYKRTSEAINTNWRRAEGRTDVRNLAVKVISRPTEISSPWSGHKTPALKPAWEPILCFRAPSGGRTYAEIAMEFGSGCLNVDGGRIGPRDRTEYGLKSSTRSKVSTYGEPSSSADFDSSVGRYPANLCFDEESAAILDEQSGPTSITGKRTERSRNAEVESTNWFVNDHCSKEYPNESGGPSRFFYCAKAGREERNSLNQVGVNRNHHPTVKPLDLCRWLSTLLLPPKSVANRSLLVPFAGTGSEMIGALQSGWDKVVGVEEEKEFCDMIPQRIEHHLGIFSLEGEE